MAGSIFGPSQDGLVSGFRADVMLGNGAPDGVVWASSGTFLVDSIEGKYYQNITSPTAGATGSTWIYIGSVEAY